MEICYLMIDIKIIIIVIILFIILFNIIYDTGLFDRIRGIGIFIEAGLLLLLNVFLLFFCGYGSIKQNIISFISANPATNIFAILTSLVLALGYTYWLGYFIVVRKMDPKAPIYGGPLSEHVITLGALFFIVLFLPLLMMFYSKPYIQYLSLNILLVFIFGFVNEYVVRILEKKEPEKVDDQMNRLKKLNLRF